MSSVQRITSVGLPIGTLLERVTLRGWHIDNGGNALIGHAAVEPMPEGTFEMEAIDGERLSPGATFSDLFAFARAEARVPTTVYKCLLLLLRFPPFMGDRKFVMCHYPVKVPRVNNSRQTRALLLCLTQDNTHRGLVSVERMERKREIDRHASYLFQVA